MGSPACVVMGRNHQGVDVEATEAFASCRLLAPVGLMVVAVVFLVVFFSFVLFSGLISNNLLSACCMF